MEEIWPKMRRPEVLIVYRLITISSEVASRSKLLGSEGRSGRRKSGPFELRWFRCMMDVLVLLGMQGKGSCFWCDSGTLLVFQYYLMIQKFKLKISKCHITITGGKGMDGNKGVKHGVQATYNKGDEVIIIYGFSCIR